MTVKFRKKFRDLDHKYLSILVTAILPVVTSGIDGTAQLRNASIELNEWSGNRRLPHVLVH
jgi:hypothetical protein